MAAGGGTLVIRKRVDGTVTLESDLPDEHVFAARFIEREIAAGMVTVEVRVKTDSHGELVYRLDGFEQITDDETGETRPNLTAWLCHREGS